MSYPLDHNGTPRTRLQSQFDGEKHLLHEDDDPKTHNKSSAMHACDHRTTALGATCYTLYYNRRHHGQYCKQSRDYVEFYGNFIDSDWPVVTDALLDLLFHCLSCHSNWSATPVFITDILSSVLRSFHPFIHSPLTRTTVSVLGGGGKKNRFVALPRCKLIFNLIMLKFYLFFYSVERPCCTSFCAGSYYSIVTTPIWHIAKEPLCVPK